MPPRQSIGLVDKALFAPKYLPFICRACCRKQAFSTRVATSRVHARVNGVPRSRPQPSRVRTASTTASVTAVNAKREIPSALQELHVSLKALEADAAIYVNTSQLHLALRGVETENPITRIAGQNISCSYLSVAFTNARDSPGAQWPAWRT